MNDEPIAFSCLHCGRRHRVAPDHAGAEVRCARCGATLRVPNAPPKRPAPNAGLVSFSCELCGTRLSEPLERVGQRVACPDCGRERLVPPPDVGPTKPAPRSVEVAPYEVYEGEQPHGVDLARTAPETIHFECRVCQTHLRASPQQIGRPVACPDCGAETPVPRPRPKAKRSQAAGAVYEVDREPDPTESIHARLYESYASDAPRAGYRGRAERDAAAPKGFPLLTDAFGLFRSRGIASVLLGLAFGQTMTGAAFYQSSQMLASGNPFGILFAALGAMIGVIAFGAVAAYALAVLDQSLEGAPRVADWPTTIPTEWMSDATRLAVALGVAAIPGGAVAAAAGLEGPAPPLIGGWLALPWVLLSQLDTGSVWGVFSPRLLRTARRTPLSWLVFYAETAALAAGLLLMVRVGLPLALLLTPLAAISVLLYAWLLGRLAWVASHATPEE